CRSAVGLESALELVPILRTIKFKERLELSVLRIAGSPLQCIFFSAFLANDDPVTRFRDVELDGRCAGLHHIVPHADLLFSDLDRLPSGRRLYLSLVVEGLAIKVLNI